MLSRIPGLNSIERYDWVGGFRELSIHLRAVGSCSGSGSQYGQT